MIDTIIVIVEWLLIILPIMGMYSTYKQYKWWRKYYPSALLKHLFISAIAVDVAGLIVIFIVMSVFLEIDLPEGVPALLLALALFISLGVKIWRRYDLRELDEDNTDVSQTVETQDQREDREFGEQRRDLEETHIAEAEEVAVEALNDKD